MKPVYWIVAVVLGIAFAGGWTWLQQCEEAPVLMASGEGASDAARALPAPAAVNTASEQPPPASSAPEAAVPAADQTAQWITDVDSTDAARRSNAITALAQAPRAQALPVLRRVLLNGEPAIDRPLALKSLRSLAISQGDEDGGVRQAMREVIYHGDDEQYAAGAQEVLDVVEQSE